MLDRQNNHDLEMIAALHKGLSQNPKNLSPKWFYDEEGSRLFEEITLLPEYYPTRTETEILREHAPFLDQFVDDETAMLELGSGASVKTRLLLDALPDLKTYAPLDISAAFLAHSAAELARTYPDKAIIPIVADFMEQLDLPDDLDETNKILFFPGSTIGNLEQSEASDLLVRLRSLKNIRAFVLGVDLVKDEQVLVDAYDDSRGVTAAFNKNLLIRLNREAGSDFDIKMFRHLAKWNADLERIEMHLVSKVDQVVMLGDQEYPFAKDETLHTESSHKYTKDSLTSLANASGWELTEFWTDHDRQFAVSVLIPTGQ